METDKTKGKYQLELKWGSYYFISSFLLSFIYVFFQKLIFNQNSGGYIILLLLDLILFICLLFKCIKEIKCKKSVGFFSKLGIALNVFIIFYILNSFVVTSVCGGLDYNNIIIPKNELEIQETNEDLSDLNGNLLKDFIAFVKIKAL